MLRWQAWLGWGTAGSVRAALGHVRLAEREGRLADGVESQRRPETDLRLGVRLPRLRRPVDKLRAHVHVLSHALACKSRGRQAD